MDKKTKPIRCSLNQRQRFESFSAYENEIVRAVEEKRVTRLSATNKLSVY